MMMKEIFVGVAGSLLVIISVLVGVAFITLLERKGLGYIQVRKGPNKVGFSGILQPFSDAIKLFLKEQTYPTFSNYYPYYLSPIFSLFLMLLVWLVAPLWGVSLSFKLGGLFMLSCLSLGVYSVMAAGWSSNSNYAMLGGLRAVAQTISYEVSLALIFMVFVLLVGSYDVNQFALFQEGWWFGAVSANLALVWFASSLAETNRTPFDFAEGESELVSGFNVEYSSGGFALIFMAEYGSILFMSYMIVVLFLGADVSSVSFSFKVILFVFGFIWVRGFLPRYRYDKLMGLAWKSYLPVTLNMLVVVLVLLSYL